MERIELVYILTVSNLDVDCGPAVIGCCACLHRCHFTCCSAACNVTEKAYRQCSQPVDFTPQVLE